jgi:hypothetical protein
MAYKARDFFYIVDLVTFQLKNHLLFVLLKRKRILQIKGEWIKIKQASFTAFILHK